MLLGRLAVWRSADQLVVILTVKTCIFSLTANVLNDLPCWCSC